MNAFAKSIQWVVKAINSMIHSSGVGGWLVLNQTKINYENLVLPEKNSIVVACVRWLQRTFSEAPPMLQHWLEERLEWEPKYRDPILTLLERPNPFYNGTTLWKAMVADRVFNGTAYWYKLRDEADQVVQLWWIPSAIIEPMPDDRDPTVFISYYEYRPDGVPRRLRVEDVIQFRDGIDPANPRKGLSPLKALLREVFTDDEAANMTASLMRNMGVPGVIIAPKAGRIGPEAAQRIKEQYTAKFTGDKKGEPLVMEGDTTIQQFGFSPEQMQLRSLRGIPEERITAVLGVNAAVVGLGAGLATTKVGAPQPLSATLWTPRGPITMGDVEEGQCIATPAGWAPVQAIYPQDEQDIYRITFQDGSTAESTFDHLWQVQLPDKRHHPVEEVLPLSAIAQFPWGKLRRVTVPLQGVTEFEEQPVLIPPYLFGLLLGDGTFRHQLCFSNTADEIIETFRKELPVGYTLRHLRNGDYRISYDGHALGRGVGNGSGGINPIKDELRRLGLWMKYSHEKFIPDVYKYNSSRIRREVLQGILDSDGFVNLHGQPALEQTSERLADDVTWMVQSLGGYTLKHRKRVNTATRLIAGRSMHSNYDRYYLSIVIEDGQGLFRFSQKHDRCRPRGKAATRKFRSIELMRREEAQCISVAGGLYLTDNFIVMHNTLREYREEAIESTVIPMYREIAAELTQQLLPEFMDITDWRLVFDLSQVRVLADDERAKSERVGRLVTDGIIRISEARRSLGWSVLPEHEIYLRPTTHHQIPAGPLRVQTNPQPAPQPPEDAEASVNGHRSEKFETIPDA